MSQLDANAAPETPDALDTKVREFHRWLDERRASKPGGKPTTKPASAGHDQPAAAPVSELTDDDVAGASLTLGELLGVDVTIHPPKPRFPTTFSEFGRGLEAHRVGRRPYPADMTVGAFLAEGQRLQAAGDLDGGYNGQPRTREAADWLELQQRVNRARAQIKQGDRSKMIVPPGNKQMAYQRLKRSLTYAGGIELSELNPKLAPDVQSVMGQVPPGFTPDGDRVERPGQTVHYLGQLQDAADRLLKQSKALLRTWDQKFPNTSINDAIQALGTGTWAGEYPEMAALASTAKQALELAQQYDAAREQAEWAAQSYGRSGHSPAAMADLVRWKLTQAVPASGAELRGVERSAEGYWFADGEKGTLRPPDLTDLQAILGSIQYRQSQGEEIPPYEQKLVEGVFQAYRQQQQKLDDWAKKHFDEEQLEPGGWFTRMAEAAVDWLEQDILGQPETPPLSVTDLTPEQREAMTMGDWYRLHREYLLRREKDYGLPASELTAPRMLISTTRGVLKTLAGAGAFIGAVHRLGVSALRGMYKHWAENGVPIPVIETGLDGLPYVTLLSPDEFLANPSQAWGRIEELGEEWDEAAAALLNAVRRDFATNIEGQHRLLVEDIPQTLGTILAYIAAAKGAGALFNLNQWAPHYAAALVGGASTGGSQYLQALEAGAPDEACLMLALGGFGAGLFEVAPVSSLLSKVARGVGGGLRGLLWSSTKAGAYEALTELGQEYLDTITGNVFWNLYIDRRRQWFEGLGETTLHTVLSMAPFGFLVQGTKTVGSIDWQSATQYQKMLKRRMKAARMLEGAPPAEPNEIATRLLTGREAERATAEAPKRELEKPATGAGMAPGAFAEEVVGPQDLGEQQVGAEGVIPEGEMLTSKKPAPPPAKAPEPGPGGIVAEMQPAEQEIGLAPTAEGETVVAPTPTEEVEAPAASSRAEPSETVAAAPTPPPGPPAEGVEPPAAGPPSQQAVASTAAAAADTEPSTPVQPPAEPTIVRAPGKFPPDQTATFLQEGKYKPVTVVFASPREKALYSSIARQVRGQEAGIDTELLSTIQQQGYNAAAWAEATRQAARKARSVNQRAQIKAPPLTDYRLTLSQSPGAPRQAAARAAAEPQEQRTPPAQGVEPPAAEVAPQARETAETYDGAEGFAMPGVDVTDPGGPARGLPRQHEDASVQPGKAEPFYHQTDNIEGEPAQDEGQNRPTTVRDRFHELFPVPTEDAGLAGPELAKLARDAGVIVHVVDNLAPKNRLGQFITRDAVIELDQLLGRDTRARSYVLAHEIGHLYLRYPDACERAGTVFRHVEHLRQHVQEMIATNRKRHKEVITKRKREKLRRQAIKAVREHHGLSNKQWQTNKALRDKHRLEVQRRFRALLDNVCRAKGCWSEDALRDELEGWTLRYAPYRILKRGGGRRRLSWEELTADAISGLLVAPRAFANTCPRVYDAWTQLGTKRPDLADGLMMVYEHLHDPDKLGEERYSELVRSFASGDVKIAEAQLAREAAWEAGASTHFQSLIMAFKRTGYAVSLAEMAKHHPSPRIRKWAAKRLGLKAAPEYGGELDPEQSAVEALQRAAMADAPVAAYFMRTYADVLRRAQQAGIEVPTLTIGMYLNEVQNQVEGRETIMPLNYDPETAAETLQWIREQMTPEQSRVMQEAIEAFATIRAEDVIPVLVDSGLISEEMGQSFLRNRYYLTHDVFRHLEEGGTISSGLQYVVREMGTMSRIASPLASTMRKDMVMLMAAQENRARRMTAELLRNDPQFSTLWRETQKGTRGRAYDVQRSGPWRTIFFREGGDLKAIDVRPNIALALDRTPNQFKQLSEIARWFQNAARTIMVEFSIPFQLNNPLRDVLRSTKNLPYARLLYNVRRQLPGMIPRLLAALPEAAREQFGEKPFARAAQAVASMFRDMSTQERARYAKTLLGPNLAELYQNFAMSPRTAFLGSSQMDPNELVRQNASMFAEMPGETEAGWRRPLKQAQAFFEGVLQTTEHAQRVAALQHLKAIREKGLDNFTDAQMYQWVRNWTGTPNSRQRGAWSALYNSVLLFSNIRAEGWLGDYDAFRTRPAEYMYKIWTYNIVPAIIKYAATIGALGPWVKRVFDDQSEYMLSNYVIVPLGFDGMGRSMILRLPMDDTGRMLHALTFKMMRYAHANLADQLEPPQTGPQSWANVLTAESPVGSVNPLITTIYRTMQFAIADSNPWVSFDQRPMFPKRLWDARHERRLDIWKHAMAHFWNINGGRQYIALQTHDVGQARNDLDKLLGVPMLGPVLKRYFVVSDQGVRERMNQILELESSEEADKWLTKEQRILDMIRPWREKVEKRDAGYGHLPVAFWREAMQLRASLVEEGLLDRDRSPRHWRNTIQRYWRRSGLNQYMAAVDRAPTIDAKVSVMREFIDRLPLDEAADIFLQGRVEGAISDNAARSLMSSLRRESADTPFAAAVKRVRMRRSRGTESKGP